MEEVPANYKTAGILMLIAGILNILVALLVMVILGFYGLVFGVMTGVGFVIWCCCLLPITQLALGVLELVTGINIMNGKPMAHASTISIVGIVVGAMGTLSGGLGMMPMILEIIATVMLNDQSVKAWLETASGELLLED
jgi:hypothetical protein